MRRRPRFVQVGGDTAERPDIIIVFRVKDLPVPVAGAQPRFCPECGASVWVAPSTLALLKRFAADPPPFKCMQCAERMARAARKHDDQPGGCPPQAE